VKLADRLAALDDVVALARDRVDTEVVAEAERVAAKAGDRLRFGAEHTVAALAGATGSGKSSLFNALAGEEISPAGLRRPTTGAVHAVTWGSSDPSQLLDWLGVSRRHHLTGGLDGLVLLDLPDVDSVAAGNRLTADRLVEQVDVLIWVLDPQKYADGALHDRYLKPLAGHAGVMLIVLNQIDRLSAAAREGCLTDLRALLTREGLGSVPVRAVSARTGEGLAELRADLAARSAAKREAERRLSADLNSLAASLQSVSGATKGHLGVGRAERARLVAALGDAAGIDAATSAVAASHRRRAAAATGWPFTRWTARLRRDPARRLRLRETPSDLVRTSLPGPSPVQRARIDTALRDLAERAAGPLPDPWPNVVRRAANRERPELPDLLDRAVAGADLGLARTPRWWRLAGVLQWLLAAVAVAGLVWLAVLFGIAWLQLPDPPLPHAGPVPVPTVMLVAGLILGALLALLARALARVGSRRASARARRAIAERVARVADDHVVAPVEAELQAHRALRDALGRLG
jgi:GTP-binding protein EngB required for normal cell division